jgi:hypothetical protein
MIKNRSRLGRERAGLSVGQAAGMLGIVAEDLVRIEERDSCYADADQARMAAVYQVNVAWLSGLSEQRDYTTVDRMRGANDLTPHDRDVIAEFAASMPRRESPEQLVEIAARVDIYSAEAHATIGAGPSGRYTREIAERRAGRRREQHDANVAFAEPLRQALCYGCGRSLTDNDVDLVLCNECEGARAK